VFLLPGISLAQCPTSYWGEMTIPQNHSAICGFNEVSALINITGSDVVAFGRMDVNFSNNVRIYSALKVADYVDNIVIAQNGHQVGFLIGELCEPVAINDQDVLITIVFNLMTGSSATVQTDFTRLFIINPCATLCTGYYEDSAKNISVDPYELNGKLLIPALFSCSGGSSTDHGLPDRKVTISMAGAPKWDLCVDVQTSATGYYECEELREDCDYNICVVGPDDAYCGIDEFDIDIIREFILDVVCPFDYEWQHFAADVNNDGRVSTLDIVHLEGYLINGNYDIPLKWKYVSNSQFDQFLVDCNSEDRDLVPVVDNCSEIIVDSDPEVEDWYGFPTGDLNGSCTTCGLKADPPVLTRTLSGPVAVSIAANSNNACFLEVRHEHSINIFSSSLFLGPDADRISHVNLVSGPEHGLIWNTDKDKGLLNLIYTHLDKSQTASISFVIEFKSNGRRNFANWRINTTDTRLNNLLIDEFKNAYPIELINNLASSGPVVYPNPASTFLFVDPIDGSDNEVIIKDMSGKFISNQIILNDRIDIRQLRPGCYFGMWNHPLHPFIFRFVKN
jgi:hypothetical protein